MDSALFNLYILLYMVLSSIVCLFIIFLLTIVLSSDNYFVILKLFLIFSSVSLVTRVEVLSEKISSWFSNHYTIHLKIDV
jgi:hypothetical protein